MDRKALLQRVVGKIGSRKFVWFGTRGADASPLLAVAQLSACFSIVAPLGAMSIEREVRLESITQRRVDLDRYSLDSDRSEGARDFHDELFAYLEEPCVVATYRSGGFFSAAYFPRQGTVEYLGLFSERQAAFEHKPWVESCLSATGVATLPWRYFRDAERRHIEALVDREAVVVRTSRSDGGVGVRLARSREELSSAWPRHQDGFVAVAPFLRGGVPLNINACVFPDGGVTLHGPSLQLIGIPDLTNRAFGYCGNDFAAVRSLPPRVIDDMEAVSRRVGEWLWQMGYLGAFGIDMLWHDNNLLVTEINPRFQGSSTLSAQLDHEGGHPDVFLCHVAAFLGLSAGPQAPLREVVSGQRAVSQIVAHNRLDVPTQAGEEPPGTKGSAIRFELVPKAKTWIESEAILFRAVVPGAVTTDGYGLDETVRPHIRHVTAVATAASTA